MNQDKPRLTISPSNHQSPLSSNIYTNNSFCFLPSTFCLLPLSVKRSASVNSVVNIFICTETSEPSPKATHKKASNKAGFKSNFNQSISNQRNQHNQLILPVTRARLDPTSTAALLAAAFSSKCVSTKFLTAIINPIATKAPGGKIANKKSG